MLSLVAKDFRVIALHLCVMVPTLGMVALGAVWSGTVFFWFAVAVAEVLVATGPAIDWGADSAAFIHSLPVSRADVVRERYVTAVVLALSTLALTTLVAGTYAMVIVSHGGAWPPWIGPQTMLEYVVVVAGTTAVFLPCVFRFGPGTGGCVFALIVGVIAVSSSRHPVAYLVTSSAGTVGLPTTGVVVLATAACALWASMRFSTRCYERREF